MRLAPLLILALLPAGCSGSTGNLSAGPGPQLPVPPKQSLLRLPPLDKGEAVLGERSARAQWLGHLRAAARSGSDWVFPNPSRSTLLRRLERQARSQTEHGMSGYTPGRQHRRDERRPVGRACDIAVSQT